MLVIGCAVVAAIAAAAISLLQENKYSAEAQLLFREPQSSVQGIFGNSESTGSPDATREAATNLKLVGLQVIADRTAQILPLKLSGDEVANMVSVSANGESNLVSVTATSSSPKTASLVANVFARQFISFRVSVERRKLIHAKRLADGEFARLSPEQRNGPRGQALSRGAEKLGILASLQTGNAELVQPAEPPTSPSSPKPLRNSVFSAFFGLFLGIGLAFLLERLNRQLRDPEEARDAFGLPILGTVPDSKAIMAANQGTVTQQLPFVENEAFRMLRASLRYFNIDKEIQSVLISSYAASVGKSTVAWNLARVAATSSKVIIVETDLRNPSLAQQHGFPSGPGLAEVLTHQVPLDQAIQAKPIDGQTNGAAAPTLDLIVAGSVPPNPAELIESQAMSHVIAELRESYEFVVIDTAPLGVVSDAFPLLREVDGVLAVAWMGRTTRDSAIQLRDQLQRLDAPVLGVIANGIRRRRGKYGYGYYGGYYGRPSDEQSPDESAVSSETAS